MATTDDALYIGDRLVMHACERDLMRDHAQALLPEPGADALEIGFGMGLFAEAAAELRPAAFTTIEAHPLIAETARRWGRVQPFPVIVKECLWQQCALEHGALDAIMYDSSEPEGQGLDALKLFLTTHAADLLRPDGRLSFWHRGAELHPEIHRSFLPWCSSFSVAVKRIAAPPPEWQGTPLNLVVTVTR